MTTVLERADRVDPPLEAAAAGKSRRALRRAIPDLCGLGSVVALACAYLSPALKDGFFFGPLDAARNGILGHPASIATGTVHNRLNGDLVTLSIPWNSLDHRLVAAGQLPLWNPDNFLGLPQFFNFQSAVFSLPDLISYAVPARVAFFVVVLVKLLLAGSGTYLCCRLCRTRPLAASFGAVTFMLSGGFANWLGWSLADVVAFAPWICAFALLAYRRRGVAAVAGLAVSVMFSLYGGFPEVSLLLALEIAAFLAVGALACLVRRTRISPAGIVRIVAGGVLGTLLAAPLLLPGAQLLSLSAYVSHGRHDVNLPAGFLSLMLAPGYYGLPIAGSTPFGQVNYYETVSYVGIIALALAVSGLFLRRRQPAVIGMAALAVVGLVGSYELGGVDPVAALFNAVGLGDIHTSRVRIVATLGIAVLAAVGVEELSSRPRLVRRPFFLASLLAVAATGALVISSLTEHLGGVEARERFDSLLWPSGLALALVLAVVIVHFLRRSGRTSSFLVAGLCAVQAAFLLFAGVGVNSYSSKSPPLYPATRALERLVGSSVVGLDGSSAGTPRTWSHVGFYPNENLLYGIDEFAGHDPALPASYARTFPARARTKPHERVLSTLLMPDISTAAEARRDFVSYLLVQPGIGLPAGTDLVADLGDERLVRVPGAARFHFPHGGRKNTVVASAHPSDNVWRLRLSVASGSRSSRLLVLGLTDVPGFSARDDGRTLRISHYGPFAMAVTVPPGPSTVTVTYWPSRFSDGIALSCLAALVLVASALVAWVRRRRDHRRPAA